MKKITLLSAVLVLCAALVACSAQKGTGDDTADSDTRAYDTNESPAVTLPATSGGTAGIIFPESRPADTHSPETRPPTISEGTDDGPYTGPYPGQAAYRVETIWKRGDTSSTDGKSDEELLALFTSYGRIYDRNAAVRTPMGIIMNRNESILSPAHVFYDKRTGEVYPLCSDPACPWEVCPLGAITEFLYVGKTHLYFIARTSDVVGREQERAIFRCDMNFTGVEKLMDTDVIIRESWTETNADGKPVHTHTSMSIGFEKIHHVEGNTLYMSKLRYHDGISEEVIFGTFDCTAKTFTPCESAAGYWVDGVWNGDTVWCFRKDGDGYIYYKADLSFTKIERITAWDSRSDGTSRTMTKCLSDAYIVMQTFDETANRYVIDFLYDPKTGKLVDIPQMDNMVCTGNAIYYTRDLTDEEIAASPLKDYYEYEFSVPSSSGRPKSHEHLDKSGGRVYRMDLDTMEETCVLEVTYRNIPVWIQNITIDGDLCYITYATYEDFHNLFNPSHEPDTRPSALAFAVADFADGTLRLMPIRTTDR